VNTLTKRPTTNATWRKIVSLATYAGVEPFLERQWSSPYGGAMNKLLDERLIKFEAKRLKQDEFNLKKAEIVSQKEKSQPVTTLQKDAEKPSLDSKASAAADEKKPEALQSSDSSGSDIENHSDKIENKDEKSASDSESSSAEFDKDLSHTEDDIKSVSTIREKSLYDVPIGASFRHFSFKSNALAEARRLFHSVKPAISLQPNPAVKAFPQVFKIPFLQKRDLLVLSASSREQAEYLFNKALKFNPVEVFMPLSGKKAKKVDTKLA